MIVQVFSFLWLKYTSKTNIKQWLFGWMKLEHLKGVHVLVIYVLNYNYSNEKCAAQRSFFWNILQSDVCDDWWPWIFRTKIHTCIKFFSGEKFDIISLYIESKRRSGFSSICCKWWQNLCGCHISFFSGEKMQLPFFSGENFSLSFFSGEKWSLIDIALNECKFLVL